MIEWKNKKGEITVTTFEKVYAAVRLIPKGRVASYGQIAAAIGNKRLSRVVGYALHDCPAGEVPCHRVVTKEGRVSPAFDERDFNRQVDLLRLEGVEFIDETHVDMNRFCVRALPLIIE